MNELTIEEKEFLKNILTQLTVRPSADDALKTVEMVRSILGKLQ